MVFIHLNCLDVFICKYSENKTILLLDPALSVGRLDLFSVWRQDDWRTLLQDYTIYMNKESR